MTEVARLQLMNAMKNQTAVMSHQFHVETITPLLMHGNKVSKQMPRIKEAELRESSFKGIYRYWWRALQYDIKNRYDLLQKEGTLFGAATRSQKVKSPIVLKLSERLTASEINTISRPHDEKAKKDVIGLVNKSFHIELRCLMKDRTKFEEQLAYFELTLLLGSFGQRSRRGAGALQLVSRSYKTIGDYVEHLKECLQKLGKLNDFETSTNSALLTLKTKNLSEHPTLRQVWIGRAFTSGEAARKAISEAGHQHNGKKGHQHLGKIDGGRQASPLIATVRKIGEYYYPIISELASKTIVTSKYTDARDHFIKDLGVKL